MITHITKSPVPLVTINQYNADSPQYDRCLAESPSAPRGVYFNCYLPDQVPVKSFYPRFFNQPYALRLQFPATRAHAWFSSAFLVNKTHDQVHIFVATTADGLEFAQDHELGMLDFDKILAYLGTKTAANKGLIVNLFVEGDFHIDAAMNVKWQPVSVWPHIRVRLEQRNEDYCTMALREIQQTGNLSQKTLRFLLKNAVGLGTNRVVIGKIHYQVLLLPDLSLLGEWSDDNVEHDSSNDNDSRSNFNYEDFVVIEDDDGQDDVSDDAAAAAADDDDDDDMKITLLLLMMMMMTLLLLLWCSRGLQCSGRGARLRRVRDDGERGRRGSIH